MAVARAPVGAICAGVPTAPINPTPAVRARASERDFSFSRIWGEPFALNAIRCSDSKAGCTRLDGHSQRVLRPKVAVGAFRNTTTTNRRPLTLTPNIRSEEHTSEL